MIKNKKYYELLYKFDLGRSTRLEGEELDNFLAASKEKKQEPNIIYNGERYYKIEEPSSQDDFQRLFMVKSLEFLNSIKNGVTFFTVLAVIGIAAAIIVPLCL